MKSRISFCDTTVLKKNLTRYAPAWVLYGVLWLLILIIMLDSDGTGAYFANTMADSLQATGDINMIYAFLCAQLLFGDLYNSRMCNALHAMPLRRETWFFTHVISGLAFSFLPNFLIMLLSATFMGSSFVVAPLWLLTNTLQFLFFFGIAVFSVYSVGNRFAMALVYMIINFFSMIAYWLVESLYAPQLYGIVIDETPFTWFCPVFFMMSEPVLDAIFPYSATATISIQPDTGFWYLLICTAVGIAFYALALLLYRRRNLECAGDFVAVRAFAPVFLILYCLCGGAVGYLFFSLFVGEENLFFLLVGIVIGWFTGRMLLERTVRVFRLKSFVGCGILLLAFFGSILLTQLDPLGVTRWIPRVNAVTGVHINVSGSRYDYYKNGNNYLSDPQDIESVLALHRYGIKNRDADVNGKPDVVLTIDYVLRSGTTVTRKYSIDSDTPEAETLEKIMSRSQIVLGTEYTDAKRIAETLVLVEAPSGKHIYGEDLVPLLEAVLKDCAEGNMAQGYAFHNNETATWLTLQLKTDENYHEYRDLQVYGDCRHTLQYLLENGYLRTSDYK